MKLGNIILAFFILIGTVFLSGLGVWQLNRLEWKNAMIARVENNLRQPPVPIERIEEMQSSELDIEYAPTFVSGEFDHTKEQHYFATHKGRSGYFVYTPLKRSSGQIVFVNRGFVPLDKKNADSRAEGLISGPVKISGLARSAPAQKPNSFVPNNDLAKNIYYWKSISQMFGQAYDKMEIQPTMFFIDADDKPVPGGLPVGGVTRIEFPNSHLQYALTWFGLAGALLVVGGYFLLGRISGR